MSTVYLYSQSFHVHGDPNLEAYRKRGSCFSLLILLPIPKGPDDVHSRYLIDVGCYEIPQETLGPLFLGQMALSMSYDISGPCFSHL